MVDQKFKISFTTQDGQRKKVTTDKPFEVMGQAIAGQYLNAARTKTVNVSGSLFASSSFTSLMDFLQSVCITFQRIVARTPVDESYIKEYIVKNDFKNAKHKIGEKVKVEHKADNDVLRDDWKCHIVLDGYQITINKTDYDDKIFAVVNDKSSIQVILNSVIEKASRIPNIHISSKGIDIPFGVNFENRNSHFAKLEYGYRNVKNPTGISEGQNRAHGLVNGFSVQAPSGFFRISMIEFSRILSLRSKVSVSTRLMKECYDIATSQKILLKKLGSISLGDSRKVRNVFQSLGKDWSVNFNTFWKYALRTESVKAVMQEISDEKMRVIHLPSNYYDYKGEREVANEEIKSLEAQVRELEKLRGNSKADDQLIAQEIHKLNDRIKDLKTNGEASDFFKSLYYTDHKSKSAKDYMSNDERKLFEKKYIYEYNKKNRGEGWRKEIVNKTLNEFDRTIEDWLNEGPSSILSETNPSRKDIIDRGLLQFQLKSPDLYNRYMYGELSPQKEASLDIKIIKSGAKHRRKDYEKELLARLSVQEAKRTRVLVESGDPALSKVVKQQFLNSDERKTLVSGLRKDISSIMKEKKEVDRTFNTFQNNAMAEIAKKYRGIKLSDAALENRLRAEFVEQYRDIIQSYDLKIKEINAARAARISDYQSQKNELLLKIEKELYKNHYNDNKRKAKRGSVYYIPVELGEGIVSTDKYGRKQVRTTVDYAMSAYKGDTEKKLDKELEKTRKKLDRLINAYRKSTHNRTKIRR